MSFVVFGGPSLYGLEFERFPIEIRPPASSGDILRATRDGATRIGLIDGLFESVPAVRHKEILLALASGIEVFGAASMGALRAAECAAFGMQGIGKIFHQYLSGERIADADVALIHAPAEFGYQPLSEALVDVDETISLMSALGEVLPLEATVLHRTARSLHFKQRDWPAIVAASDLSAGRQADVLVAVGLHRVSQKGLDAMALLVRISSDGDAAPAGIVAGELNRTVFLDEQNRILRLDLHGRSRPDPR